MACQAWSFHFDNDRQLQAVNAQLVVTPEDFCNAYIYTALKTNNATDLDSIIKNAAMTFNLALDRNAVAAPWKTEKRVEVDGFNATNFNFSEIYRDDQNRLKNYFSRVYGPEAGSKRFTDFINTAMKMEDVINGRSNMKLDVAEFRKTVRSAAEKEIAAKGLDEKKSSERIAELLNKSRNVAVKASGAAIRDRFMNSDGGLIKKDGRFLKWWDNEREAILADMAKKGEATKQVDSRYSRMR